MRWVFGYGSLMWDGWESAFSCRARSIATLPGYRRTFNKLSVKNWGTNTEPGLTLNLEEDGSASCVGMAFAFDPADWDSVLAYLINREGKGFAIEPLMLHLADGAEVKAVVSVYNGPNLRTDLPLDKQVRMVRAAQGTSGACTAYVAGIADQLDRLGIDDPAVRAIRAAISP